MASANIYIMDKEPDKQGLCKLMFFFSYKGKRFKMSTGEKCSPEHFDKNKQRANKKHPFQVETNFILDKLCADAMSHYKMSIAKGVIPSPQELKDAIKPKTKADFNIDEQDIAYYFDLLHKNQIARGLKKGTRAHFTTLRNTISKFERYTGLKITLFNFDSVLHTKFVEYLIYEIDLSPNTLAVRNKHIKQFFKFCEEELEILNVNQFYKKIKPKFIDVPIIHLTERELKLIEKLEVGDDLERVKDYFLFGCYTGRRYSEMDNLTYSNISTNERGIKVLTFYEEKNIEKGAATIALNDNALDIINKYANHPEYKHTRYILPKLTNQTINKRIKKIGELAGINKATEKIIYEQGIPKRIIVPKYLLLRTHICRHTYATLSSERGMPMPVLQKDLNHSKMSQTMVYNHVTKEHQHDTTLKIWNKPKEEEKEMEQIQKEINLDVLTNQILKADEGGVKTLTISYQLSKEAIADLQQKGFSVKDTSPIEKLKGMYHTISW